MSEPQDIYRNYAERLFDEDLAAFRNIFIELVLEKVDAAHVRELLHEAYSKTSEGGDA